MTLERHDGLLCQVEDLGDLLMRAFAGCRNVCAFLSFYPVLQGKLSSFFVNPNSFEASSTFSWINGAVDPRDT